MPALRIIARDPATPRSRRRYSRPPTARCARRRSCRSRRTGSVRGLVAEEVAGARLRDGARQHVPSVPAARRRADRALRRAAPLHGLGAGDHHRLGRLPGLLDGARDGRRRDQGTRAAAAGEGAILAIEEEGVRFRSYIDGAERFLTPGDSRWRCRRSLRSDIVLAFDECTPFHVERDYTARSTERTHRWLARCLAWRAARTATAVAVLRDRAGRRLRGPARGVGRGGRRERRDGVAIGGSLGRDKAQMYEVVEWCTRELATLAPERPRHLLGIGEIDDLIRGVELGIDTFDCAMPTRLARHGVALVPDPATRWRLEVDRPRWREAPEPLVDGCPCPACSAGLSRAYLHFLARGRRTDRCPPADPAQPDVHRGADA